MPEFKNEIRHNLAVEMAKADMSPQELADKSGVSIDTIYLYMRGKTVPLLETACRIADAIGCTPNDLCGWKS